MDIDIDIASHTLVRNGMPYLDLVLRAVQPYMKRMLITVSEKSTDGSLDVIRKLEKDYPSKVRVFFENVDKHSNLTKERQKLVDLTSEEWILFLDDDDLISLETLEKIKDLIKEDFDAYAISPIQVIDEKYYDKHWYEHKFFTKLFRNKNIVYHNPWPRDVIFSGDKELYWKKNTRTKRIYGGYFHLSNMKFNSFRKEGWTKNHYIEPIKNQSEYPEWCKPYIEKIYSELFKYRHK